MATKPIQTNPTADLPTTWSNGQTVAPNGPDVGLAAQYGYNYLNGKVNEALTDVGVINDAFSGLQAAITTTGILKGSNGAISAAVAGTDYVIPSGSITGTAGGLSATLGVSKGGTGKTSVTKNAILAGNASSTTGALAAIATASGALYATAANGAATFGTLPVAQGGTGATSAAGALTNLGAAAASHTHAASDITGTLGTAHGGTGNTSVDTAPTSGSTKMVTSGGLYTTFSNKLGRTTNVSAADTNYTTYMVRGAALVSSETTPTNNGQIAWVYE